MPSTVKHLMFIVAPLIIILAVLPGVYQNHLLLFNFVIFLVLAQGVNIIYGFTGYLPFGYVGFFGAGAYGFAIMVMHFQTPAPLAVLVGGIVGIALGLLLTPLLRLSGGLFRDRQSGGLARGVAFRRQSGAGKHHQGAVRRVVDRYLQSQPGLCRSGRDPGADPGRCGVS